LVSFAGVLVVAAPFVGLPLVAASIARSEGNTTW
jgi:hypothetical protein